ncbi:MAG: glycosyltransferase family 2 protein [Chitinophagales bacterium]|nr:glycosyltransferase family 2 protein [Chitinophagales bacterium]MDW8427239.1 glycosyltransferase [Chitinophagales bacterium]
MQASAPSHQILAQSVAHSADGKKENRVDAVCLSVIIVSYNVRFFLEQALLSVQKAVRNINAEIIVVDNHSVDGTVHMLRQRFPSISLLVNDQNVGFARANNQALKLARGRYILLLNPDTVIEEDTLEKCIMFMEEHPECGAVGVKMLDGKGNFLPESKRGFPTPFVAFCKLTGLSRLFPRSGLFNRYYLGHLSPDQIHEVDVLSGAFMFLRREALEKVGHLDEAFFMYGEDIDLSYRIQKAGYKNFYLPITRIIHYKGESTRRSSLNYVRLFYQAMIVFANKHFSNSSALLVLLLQLAIYLRAAFSIAARLMRRLALPLCDAVIIYGGMLAIKSYWETHVKAAENLRYPDVYTYVVMPLYVVFWISGIALSGAYRRGASPLLAVRGVFWATLAIAAIYAFLPETMRFSRAQILLGFAWASFSTLLLRMLLHLIQYGNLRFGEAPTKKTLIIGEEPEADRVAALLHLARVPHDLIGYVSPQNGNATSPRYLGNINQLADIVAVFRADEVIFCAKDISTQAIMEWMTRLGPSLEYKIVPQDSLTVIGSNSSTRRGELYAIDIRLNIDSPSARRSKRWLDLAVALLLLPFLPATALVVGHPRLLLTRIVDVLRGRLTWVGYGGPPDSHAHLPRIRPGVFSTLDVLPQAAQLDDAAIQRLNFLYAKDYTPAQDLTILLRNWRRLAH